MNMEEIENYITELESMFELSELEEHSRNILKVGIYIKQLQQENSRLKEELEELKHKHYLIQGGRGSGKTYLLHLQQENQELKKQIEEYKDNYNCLLKQKEVIDKAIEYINKCISSPDIYEQFISRGETKQLLDILKEVPE